MIVTLEILDDDWDALTEKLAANNKEDLELEESREDGAIYDGFAYLEVSGKRLDELQIIGAIAKALGCTFSPDYKTMLAMSDREKTSRFDGQLASARLADNSTIYFFYDKRNSNT